MDIVKRFRFWLNYVNDVLFKNGKGVSRVKYASNVVPRFDSVWIKAVFVSESITHKFLVSLSIATSARAESHGWETTPEVVRSQMVANFV